MTAVMRAATSLLAISLVLAGCSLVASVGGRPVVAQVRNSEAIPVTLTIESSAGVIHGAVQPSSLAAGGSAAITFLLPQGDDWWIMVNGAPMFGASDVNEYALPGCGSLVMEVSARGGGSIGCIP